MTDSILTSTKKLFGLEEDYVDFDVDIITYINSAFMALNQIGVGPTTGFLIEDKTATWTTYFGTTSNLESAKTYVYLKVRLIFDPPSIASVIEAMERQAQEIEWRLMTQAEGG